VEEEMLFGPGCPICGWVSPLVKDSHVDVLDEGDTIRIALELHDAEEGNIKLVTHGNKLRISSGRFNRIILLRHAPGEVIEKTYKNGVLELKLRKSGCETGR